VSKALQLDFFVETSYNPYMTKIDEYKSQIDAYIHNVNKLYLSGNATEHSYRSDLQVLISGFLPDCQITNEPKRIECGAPDFIITRKDIPVGYIEAKDIGISLDSKNLTEQFDRYKAALNNLVLTDYLDFRFYQEASCAADIRIGTVENGHIKPMPENFENFFLMIKAFSERVTQSIKSPQKLAQMMANKAKMLANIISGALKSDKENLADSSLKDQMEAFKKLLIHDIEADEFADIYAQTIAYGMFAARYHDPTLIDFSRHEAAEMIPKSNPFLRKFFQYIAGYDVDDRIVWIVDELVSIFLASDVADIMRNFGTSTKIEDPVIHFYETFLAAYDPALRKARGVWYTPQPVVNFIVRAVDDILKIEFGLPQGLADNSKISIPSLQGGFKDVHKVQILDPAAGTGTFLAEVIKHIYRRFEGQQGIWSKYVSDHLIPRLNGFELLMASYAMAHLKLDILFAETGYKPIQEQRLRIFLTNSLEEYYKDAGTLFSSWLSNEANLASQIKRDTPVMVVLGNPPYSGESQNKGKWIMDLMEDYKTEPGGKEKLDEKNSKWINDDYVKFLRFGQYFIEKNKSGILAYINPHGFLDNPTFRGMRWSLLKTFDKIYTIDLHGNNKKREKCPDGSPDENVFDIMQGVSINLLIKTGKKKNDELGKVYHYDLFGKREIKYNYLLENSFKKILYEEVQESPPNYFFNCKSNKGKYKYDLGLSLVELFKCNGVGITTAHDEFVINDSKTQLLKRFIEFKNTEPNADVLHKKFNVKIKDGWNILYGWKNIQNISDLSGFIQPISYRPFDTKYIFYEDKLVWRTVRRIMDNLLKGCNLGLMTCRQTAIDRWEHVGITKLLVDDSRLSNRTRERGYVFPLYTYTKDNSQKNIEGTPERTPNLKKEIVDQIAAGLGLKYTDEKETTEGTFAPIDILDYIYAVLHSPSYREKYKEFLKIDFPRVPYPKDAPTFWQLVALGGELRQIHLLESPKVEQYITKYPIDGNNVVEKVKYENNNVYINDTQYFANVPQVAWEFFIGGYQPAQKWLKDRKGRELTFEDIFHYQKIIVALVETSRLMSEIDSIAPPGT